ncbi:MAG: adenylate/guanylate cyclase domain-containing protein [Rhodocyclales bacterium GT-UBC]|nr:MAG: adenylate/guanylate cyclase domain-containing protein [Rhodocyclales bacterium GT-UBC]
MSRNRTLPALLPALALPTLSVLAGLCLLFWDPLPLQNLRNASFDQYQRWQPRIDRDAPVRIIDIDDESLRRLGQWPWPRTRLAEMLNALQQAGPAAVAFDMLFAEADRTSPRAMLDLWSLPLAARQQINRLPDHDTVFAAALAASPSILGYPLERNARPGPIPESKARYVMLGASPLSDLHTFSHAIRPLPELEHAAGGSGSISFIPDGDGVVRRVPLLSRLGDAMLPSLSAEALRLAQGASNYLTLSPAESGAGLAGVRIGQFELPTTRHGEVWLHYSPSLAKRYIPAWQVFAGKVPDAALAGHILLVGTSAQGLMDLRFSPLGSIIPGVEIHAQALEQFLTGDMLVVPAWSDAAAALIIVVVGLLVGCAGLYMNVALSCSLFLSCITLLGATSWILFSTHRLLFDVTTPALAVTLSYALGGIVRHRLTERRQRWIKQVFARYVSPNLVAYLIKQPDALQLGGRRQECSFVFTDLAGFTTWIEQADPEQAVSLINEYLDQMIAIAFAHDGTLDRIVGDAVVIMFSAPVPQADHARRALACALEMQRFSSQYADQLLKRGITFGRTRIGVHSGEVIVGNFGGKTIFDYRALGDPINTAARLESANKTFGTLLCVSGATLAACPGWPARPIGQVILKGKSQALAVFEPIDPTSGSVADPDYLAAFALMQKASPAALAAFQQLAEKAPDDPLIRFHLHRLENGQVDDLIVMSKK